MLMLDSPAPYCLYFSIMSHVIDMTGIVQARGGGEGPSFIAEQPPRFQALDQAAHLAVFHEFELLWHELEKEAFVTRTTHPLTQASNQPAQAPTHRSYQLLASDVQTHEPYTNRIIGEQSGYTTMSFWGAISEGPGAAGIVVTRQQRREVADPDHHRSMTTTDHALAQVVLRPTVEASRTAFMFLAHQSPSAGQPRAAHREVASFMGVDMATIAAIQEDLKGPALGKMLDVIRRQRARYGEKYKTPLQLPSRGNLSFLTRFE